ncbi:MAG: TlpA disulfide reductase family protein [Acidobacteriota bacterium]
MRSHRSTVSLALFSLFALALLSCRPAPSPAGQWRGVFTSPGGELPFGLRIDSGPQGLRAVVQNGSEEAPVSAVELKGSELTLRFDGYDSRIVATIEGDALTGKWEKRAKVGYASMPMVAHRIGSAPPPRFRPASEAGIPALAANDASAIPSVSGPWAVEFVDEEGTSPAEAELKQESSRVTGTFRTPTGDHRYLEGSYEGGILRLSAFDGAHAFLYQAHAEPGGTLRGDFWSRDSYHATWTARRASEHEAVLPDAWQEVGLTNPEGKLRFSFPDLAGKPVTLDDPRFAGKVVIVNLFGSWCPNCNDEGPYLASLHKRYGDRGLEIVGLAFEVTGDANRDREFVRRFGVRYGISYPLLLAGTNDKKEAGAALPDLTRVASFPTTVFLGRDGKARKIHSGFDGPGTGEHFAELKKEFEGLIEVLLAEA